MTIHPVTINRFWMLIVVSFLLLPLISHASTTDGTIQSQYAWGENVGWVNFLPTSGNIHVTNTGITGYAWDSNYGWINFAPTQSGVLNDGNGNLSGSAWSAGGGWINFSGVAINSSGKFTGVASGSIYGRLTFDCDQCNVTTDWRPAGGQSTSSGGSSGYSAYNNFVAPIVNYLFPTTINTNPNNNTANVSDVQSDDVESGDSMPRQNNRQPNVGQNTSTPNMDNSNDNLDSTQNAGVFSNMPTWQLTLITIFVVLFIFILFRIVVTKK